MFAKGHSAKAVRFLLVVMLGLFSFSEGKPCPEKTRAHKTRCDSYFKCVMLPSKSHVWIPEKCEQGLVYEPNLRICVLPGDDWECNLGDSNKSSYSDDDNVVFGVGLDGLKGLHGLNGLAQSTEDPEVVLDTTVDNEDIIMEDINSSDYSSVGSGDNATDFESSGDGVGPNFIMVDTVELESKTSNEDDDVSESNASPTKVDPKLTAHLQRLSQLIDGLKQTYQNKESAVSDLRPDQLNAFLAHYNIKSQLDSLSPVDEKQNTVTTTTTVQMENYTEPMATTTPSSDHLDPETKVVLTNQVPTIYGNKLRPTDGYTNSQIVVNKPEGSVLFTLGNQPQDQVIDHRYDPKISEETLKTVLELSKQMIENQNVRQMVPNSYYPHVVQPIYLPPPMPQYAQSMFNQHDGYDDKKYDKVSSTYYVPQDKNEKSPTTIIHNNVITSLSDSKPDDQLDSYGQKLGSYPPLNDHQYSSSAETSSENQNHKVANRYENNQLVTIRPTQSYSGYHFQNDYRPTTTSRPYLSDSGSTLTDYYTPSPHLDESNVNSVFQVERYPTVNYGNVPPPPPGSPQSSYNSMQIQNQNQNQNQNLNQNYNQNPNANYNQNVNPNPNPNANPTYNRPNPSQYLPQQQQQQQQQDNPYSPYYNPYQSYYYPTHTPQSLNKLFPSMDASKVKIRPNSQKLESMEQENADESSSQSEEDQNSSSSSNDDNQSQTYNSYVNKQIVANQLAQYIEHLNDNRPQRYGSSASTVSPLRNRLPLVSQLSTGSQYSPISQLSQINQLTSSNQLSQIDQLSQINQLTQQNEDDNLLNLSGNIFGYDDYKTKLEDPAVDTNNCPAGVRQPNTTDCTRYYMCSRTDSTVVQYTCPDFTAFNPQSRICDAHFYALCHPGAVISRYTVTENRRIQMEALKALQNAQRIRDQAMQAQKLALRLGMNKAPSGTSIKQQQYVSSTMSPAEYPSDVLANILQSAIEANSGNVNSAQSTSVTPRPHGPSYSTSMVTKKRKYYCKEGDKVADQTSIYNYFICYKNAQGMMKGHKMTCMQGLLFCPMTLVCTLPERCQ